MRYSVSDINNIVGGQIQGNSNLLIEGFYFDSRKINHVLNGAFVAIITESGDGHKYIDDCIKRGISIFIVSNAIENESITQIIVPDTIVALHTIAKFHRENYKGLKVLGITGSNGKTTVKERLFDLLRQDYEIVRSPKSYNSQLGVPISLLKINESHTLGLFEAGISRPEEMTKLEALISPEIGVLTHFGDAHDSGFVSREKKLKEKLILFRNAQCLIFPLDLGISETIRSTLPNCKLSCWSRKDKSAKVFIEEENLTASNANIQIKVNDQRVCLNLNMTDKASLNNLYTTITTLVTLNYPLINISEKIEKWTPLEMRLKIEEGINNSVLINDSYNADWDSLEIGLTQLERMDTQKRNMLILSDLEERIDGKDDFALRQLLITNNVDRFVGIGNSFFKNSPALIPNSTFFQTTEKFLERLDDLNIIDYNILIKGRRSYHFDKIHQALKRSSHEAILEVDLSSLIHNYNYLKSILKANTKTLAMVKAFSYGSGAVEIAKTLAYHKVDYLGVAYVDEGIALRNNGLKTPILVMNPDVTSLAQALEYNLEPEIFDFTHLDALIRLTKSNFYNAPIPIHIKLETGMNRLGFTDSDIQALVLKIKENDTVQIASIFSHLAESNIKDSAYTKLQIAEFDKMSSIIIDNFEHEITRHLLNTDGVINYPEAQFDMVRLGIGIYGHSSDAKTNSRLLTVSTFKSNVSQIKKVNKGDSIGYSRQGTAPEDGFVAIIPVGYADGFDRRLGNGNWSVAIRGQSYPTIGNICMDMTMIFIGSKNVFPGDEVVIFGDNPSLEEMSVALNTIPYEVLTKISRRVRRIYLSD
jgi:alanine racemase